MDKKMKKYIEISRKFARKQLVERFCFEMELVEKLFGKNDYNLETLINDCRGDAVFTEEEYQEIFEESKKLKKEHSILKELL